MNQFQGGKSIMAFDNYECNCFGEVKHELQFFLSKQRGPQGKTVSMTNLTQLANLPIGQLKGSIKRSLRRTNTDLVASPQTHRKSLQNEEACSLKDSSEIARDQEKNQITATFAREVLAKEKSSCSNEESSKLPDTPTRTAVFFKTASCQNILPAAQNPPLTSFTPSPTRNIPLFNSPSSPIRINFKQTPPSSPEINVLQPSHLVPPIALNRQNSQHDKYQHAKSNVFLPLKEIKEQINVKLMGSAIKEMPMTSIEELSEMDRSASKMERLKTPKTPRKDLKGFSGKQDTYKSSLRYDAGKMKLDIAKSRIDTMKSRIDTGKSRIDTGKSRIDHAGKSRIDTKKSLVGQGLKHRLTSHRLKDNRTGLKKMDDVEEIHSLPDEDEREDSDQQSVVLGRLHEYGSMVEPRMDEAPSSPTITSKLISLKTQQSSTIGKSYLRSFEFGHDRPLFK